MNQLNKSNASRIKRSDRQRVLAEWRGMDPAPIEKAAQDRSRCAGQLVDSLLTRLNIGGRQKDIEIQKVWNHSLDPTVVKHAQPTALRKGTLIVSVDNSAWLSELVRYRRRDILRIMQHSFGPETIQRISFRIG